MKVIKVPIPPTAKGKYVDAFIQQCAEQRERRKKELTECFLSDAKEDNSHPNHTESDTDEFHRT